MISGYIKYNMEDASIDAIGTWIQDEKRFIESTYHKNDIIPKRRAEDREKEFRDRRKLKWED